ncbi:nucleotide-binding alpha-beta plait domain-containing protein [Artemisia annua]|uniref:Nucleotide-binding alpha-beta plait domain-containing protein n=1 Tax=Artemisia annua TaxID=35608 RepID=A0A2U1MEZ8_ARTAN|nr:nucleotide-binding alpha-beta plait domain-containing protein [Artemisia annua]
MEEEKKVETNAEELKADHNEELKAEDDLQERLCFSDEEKDKDMDDDELTDEKREEHGDLGFEEEHEEITAASEERRRRKNLRYLLVLDRDAATTYFGVSVMCCFGSKSVGFVCGFNGSDFVWFREPPAVSYGFVWFRLFKSLGFGMPVKKHGLVFVWSRTLGGTFV